MVSNPRLARAVRIALITSAASASVAITSTASAQDQEQLDQITGTMTVTGSRIVRQDFEAASPIVTVSSEAFDLSGEVQIEQVLNSLPQLVPSITTTSNNPSNGGQANVDLRGLGVTRTLVLMDGQRLAASNVNGVIDLNTIPSALIEGVEILTGGASAAYGSDAISGVVNVRMKRNFSGVKLSLQNNVTGESDGRTFLAEATMGGNFADDRGNAVFALTYDKRDEVLAGARDFGTYARSAVNLSPVGSGTIPEGRIDWGANAPTQAALDAVFGGFGGTPGQVPGNAAIGFNSDQTLFSLGRNTAAQPVVNFRGDTSDPGFNPLSYSYNYSPVNYLQLPLERRQIAGFGRYDMIPDKVEMYARMMFTTYNADQELAATPVTCANATIPGCIVPVSNDQIPTALRTLLESRPGTVNGVANNTLPLNFTVRTLGVGPRNQENSYDVLQGVAGFRGDFQVGERNFSWDFYGSYGRAEGTSLQAGNVSRSRLQAALNNPDAHAARGCTDLDPFGLGNLTPECANAIAIRTTNVLETEQFNYVGSITGDLFNLPAGAVAFAAGAEYRENTANFRPDEFLASGDVVGFNAQQPVDGRLTVVEPFAELVVPVLSDLPGADYLGVELGYRNSNYNIAGSYDTYKGALQWNPLQSLKLRGSYNRAIRAPNISELFLPRQESFPQYTDPCNENSTFRNGANAAQVDALCIAQGIPGAFLEGFNQPNSQARSFIGGNVNLTPEEADTYTYGFVWQSPMEADWISNFSVAVDYFEYEIKDVISSLTASSIIGRCFNQLNGNPTFDINNQFCDLFTRNAGNFGITDVVTTQINLSSLRTDGVDVNLDWGLPLTAFGGSESAGQLDFQLRLTHLLSWEQQETSVDPFLPREGTISQTVASAYPDLKAVLATTYSVGDLMLRYNLRYIEGMDVINNDAALTPSAGIIPIVDDYMYHDLTAKYDFNEMFALTVGVLNIGDKQPPIYTTTAQAGIQANTDPSTYDVLGRRYFINLTASF